MGGPGGRSINIHYARLLTEQEINQVRDRFHEDAEFLLEEALRKHVRSIFRGYLSIQHDKLQTQVPWWLWALLAFFAADNLMSWLSSPLVFYPAMLVLGALVIVHSLGLTYIVLPLVKQTVWFTVRRMRIDRLF